MSSLAKRHNILCSLQKGGPGRSRGGYEFDVYIQSTSGTITLTSYQLVFTLIRHRQGRGTDIQLCCGVHPRAGSHPSNGEHVPSNSTVASQISGQLPMLDRMISRDYGASGRFRIGSTVRVLLRDKMPMCHGISVEHLPKRKPFKRERDVRQSQRARSEILAAAHPARKLHRQQWDRGICSLRWRTLSEVDNFGFEVERSLWMEQGLLHPLRQLPGRSRHDGRAAGLQLY